MAKEEFTEPAARALRQVALGYPEVSEGDSCVKRSFKARKKGFLYLGEDDEGYNLMIKLDASLPDAEQFAASHAGRHDVGESGWVTLRFSRGTSAPDGLLEAWIDESFRLQAPKTLLSQLDEAG